MGTNPIDSRNGSARGATRRNAALRPGTGPAATGAAAWVAAALLALALCSSCASIRGVPSRTAAPGASAPASAPARAPEGPLAPLPPAARDFLAELRDRVRRGEWAWAADRADPSFRRSMEGRGRDAYFYTYLFAAGTLATDGDEYGRFELLPLARVRDMVWEEARIEGPAAVVRGRFTLSSGAPVPFSLRVLWRLDPPQILGVQP